MRRISINVFVLVVFLAVVRFLPAEETNKGQWEKLGASNTVDNDDVADKVDSEIKVAQSGTGKGVVWGKSNKASETKVDDTEKLVEEEKEPPKRLVETSKKVAAPIEIESSGLPKLLQNEKQVDKETAKISGENYLLRSDRKVGSTDLVETLLEVSGDIKQVGNDLKTTTEKMEVVAGFRYEERIAKFSATSSGSLVSVREYDLAKAKMKIGKDTKNPELDESLRTIVSSLENDKVSLFSPNGSLRGEQLLLVEDLPGNTLTLDRLLPNKEVKVGDTWKISDNVLRSFISVDAVTESNVEAVLTAVADNMAMVEIVGDVNGIYLGAATEMSIRAKYQFDIAAKRINWLGVLIEENRSIGHVGPGLDLVARLQVKISPIAKPQKLTDAYMDDIQVQPTEKLLTLKYDGGKGPWRFSHGRDWYIFQDDPTTTILRKLYRGELVAQCNIADMGKVDVKTMTTLPKFQKELSDGLGKNFGKVVAAEELENKYGYKEFNVIIDGTVDDLNLRWIYSLLTDKDGQQSVIVFVIEAGMIEQFGNADRVLLGTYRMGKK